MNLRKLLLLPALLIVLISSFFSCGVDRWPEYAKQTELDMWIYDTMKQNYLWYQDMPAYDKVNVFLSPTEFLTKIISKQDNGYSFVDSVLDAPIPSYGFDYSLVRNTEIDTAYNALITYIIPGSPAEKAGLKRGEWIMKFGEFYISQKNEKKLLQGTAPVSLTIGTYQKIEPEPGDEEEGDIYDVVPSRTGVQMGAAVSLEDPAVHTYDILTLKNNSKIGYLMYNSFTAGTEQDPNKYNAELLRISNEFKSANIQALVLDFRYNEGGTIACAQLLATMLAPSAYLNQTMAFLEYNDKNIDKNATLTFDPKLLQGGSNLNLNTVIVLTGSKTAGAPEMVTYCLNEKVQRLLTIGAATKGQNVGTERFVNTDYRWALNPVVCTIYNSEHVTQPGGIKATYAVSEATDYKTFLPFGDPKELLLSTAIGFLEGTYPPASSAKSQVKTGMQPVKSVSSPASRRFVGGLRVN